MSTPIAVRTHELGKRYGNTWALRNCTLDVPAGSVTALVGPNGAGKTTLLHLLMGLARPTHGTAEVFDLEPRRDAKRLLPRLGFVAQDHPLYRGLTVAETLELGRKLNPHFDPQLARARVDRLGLKRSQKVGRLSGGQQAQVALTLALAKRPELLILDEPVASLDPLARREFLNAVLEAVAESQLTVILSSHIVAELERVCDHLVTLAGSKTQLAGPIGEILATHRVLTGLSMANAYHHDGLASCLGLGSSSSCAPKIDDFRLRFQSLLDLGDWFTLVPGLIGVLLAAPFVLDLEQGTYRLTWTQSVTRGRWLAGKLGLAVVGALIAGGALSLLFSWWRRPEIQLDGRLLNGTFDTVGVVAIGYTLFALALTLAVGAVWRRTALSLTVGFVGYFATRVAVDFKLRDRLVSPLHATWRGATKGPATPAFLDHAKVLDQVAYVGGHAIGFGGRGQIALPNIDKVVFHLTYLPARDFWPLQLAELGLFAAASALLLGFAAWWTHQRAA